MTCNSHFHHSLYFTFTLNVILWPLKGIIYHQNRTYHHLPLIGGQHLYWVALVGTSSAVKLKKIYHQTYGFKNVFWLLITNDSWMRVIICSFIEHPLLHICIICLCLHLMIIFKSVSLQQPWKTWDNDGKSRQWEGVPLPWRLSQLAEQRRQRGELHKEWNEHSLSSTTYKITLTFILSFW